MEATRQVIHRLLEVLKTLGLSQHDVALRLGIQDSGISQWKSGFRSPSVEQLQKLQELMHEEFYADANRQIDELTEDTQQVTTTGKPDPGYDQRRDRRRQRSQKYNEAILRYRAALDRWMELTEPGSNYQNLQADVQRQSQVIREYFERGEQSWTISDRKDLSRHLAQLQKTLGLLNVLDRGEMPGD